MQPPLSAHARAVGWWGRLLDWATPANVDENLRRRARTLAGANAIIIASALACAPYDIARGSWPGGLAEVGGAALSIGLFLLLRRGHVLLTGHIASGLVVSILLATASGKGGLVSTELTWEAAAIMLATLVLGSRGALVWTVIASLGLAYYAARFDPSWVAPREAALGEPAGYAFEVGLLYWAVWGIGFAFNRARSDFVARLSRRNEEMRRVLAHARDGLLTIDREGRIAGERSAQAAAWIGEDATGRPLWEALAPGRPDLAGWLELGWRSVVEDELPREVTLDQLPRRVVLDGRVLDLGVTVIDGEPGPGVEPPVAGALVVLHDATDEVARENAEAARRDVVALFEQIRRDAGDVERFLREMHARIEAMRRTSDPRTCLRELHTIKGNAALFGMSGLSKLCHEIEERAAGGLPARSDVERLVATWSELARELGDWCTQIEGQNEARLSRRETDVLRRALAEQVPYERLAAALDALELTPVANVLDRLGRQASVLATRLGKEVDVAVEAGDVRCDADEIACVSASLVHVIRNALDHGIEAPGARVEIGKPRAGQLRLRAALASRGLRLEVIDDGAGIDWAAVRRKATALGMPAESVRDLARALYDDGFSTSAEATLVSGRGVGLGALRASAEALGGTVEIATAPGRGTRVIVTVPVRAASVSATLEARAREASASSRAEEERGAPARAA